MAKKKPQPKKPAHAKPVPTKRTLAEIAAAAKADPTSISAAEKKQLLQEIKRRGIAGASTLRPDYERIKEEARKRRAEASRQGRDIGELPPVADPARKARALASVRVFNETYFRRRYRLAWSQNHLALMEAQQRTVDEGGCEVDAVERGFGKTSLQETGAIYAVCKGHPYALLLGASKAAATEMLESIKGELEDNDDFAADFPEIAFPIRAIDGINNRCKGQLYRGKRTNISITKEELTLPTIPGSPASGAIIRVVGIMGRIRGRKKRLVRPTIVFGDDLQTDASAKSLAQTEKREQIVVGAVRGLAGPGQQISVLIAGTVIRPGDLMDRLLATDKHLDWVKHRFKMLPAFPTNLRLWEEYWVLRCDEIRNGGVGTRATEFYRDRREMMDEGAVVAWPQRFKPGELSAVQHAMNLFFANPEAFYAEYQNDPRDAQFGQGQLEAGELLKRVNGLERGVAPLSATKLTAFIDVKHKLLHWMVCAWADDFTGAVIDYGTWPDQRRAYFAASEAQHTIQHAHSGGVQAALLAALNALSGKLLAREFAGEGRAALKIARLLVDAKLGDCTDTVYLFARRSPHAALILPSEAKYVGAKSKPWHMYQHREGQRLGTHWYVAPPTKRQQNAAFIDVNWWKTFCRDRLLTAAGDRGALTFFGRPNLVDHRLLCDHLCAEYGLEVTAKDRTVVEWQMRGERFDNDWLDTLVGCAAAASIEGCALFSERSGRTKSGKQQAAEKLAKFQARRRAG
jgi:hypothetical protein